MSEGSQTSGTQQVAAFLLSLDRENALDLLRHLDADIVSDVAAAMTELGENFSAKDSISELYLNVSREINTPPQIGSQSDSQLRILLEEAFDASRAEVVLQEIRQRQLHERPFCDVENYPARVLASALREESPASAAIVLSHISPNFSADVIGALDPDVALETITNMATLVSPDGAILKSMAQNLLARLEVIAKTPEPPDPSTRLKTIAEMLNFSSSELEQSVMEGLETERQELADEIREFMFGWTDLATVDKRSMQKILGVVETRTLAIALKACAADVEANVAGNLSSRVKAMVIEERELAGPVPMREVLSARGEILKAVHALIESGDFQPSRSGEELVS
ncbi:MAG: flagellar motor switch protein FliG [Planctomycetota bacterium]|jgi:flagellar motor switch protein FliG